MKRFRILLMLAMLFVGIGGYAQTVVEFVAGVDKGRNPVPDRIAFLGSDRVEKNGVTMSPTNVAFGGDKYMVMNVFIIVAINIW